MELVKEINLRGLTEQEKMLLNGGKVDWGSVGTGVFEMIAGVVEGVGGLVMWPTSKVNGSIAIVDGGNRFCNGLNTVVNAGK